MKKSTAMARKNDQITQEAAPVSGDNTQLDRRYGEIGIPAVAAAVRYQGEAKNPAYAPVPNRWEDRNEEAA